MHLLPVGVVIPDHLQGTVFLAADQGIGAVFIRVGQGLKLRIRHIFGIEAGTGGTGAVTLQERRIVNAVPRAVIHIGEVFFGRVGQVVKRRFRAENLFPIDGVGLVGGETIQIQNLLAIVGDS